MLDYDVVAEGLVKLCNWWSVQGVWNCGMAFSIGPVFEEAYAVRGTISACRAMDSGRGRIVAHSFCDRAMLTQGAVEENMYYMGYGNNISKENGLPNCSCVADASSTAAVLIDTIKAYPDSADRQKHIDSLQRFVDYVLEMYTSDEGIIQVGILDHRRDVLPNYWCANVLFSEVLVGLAEITQEEKYFDAAKKVYQYMASMDYKHTHWREWDTRKTHVILYAGEGILSGLLSSAMKSRLDVEYKAPLPHTGKDAGGEAVVQEALNRVTSQQAVSDVDMDNGSNLRDMLMKRWCNFYEWLYNNQQPFGIWNSLHDDRCYEAGISALLVDAIDLCGEKENTFAMINRQLRYLLSRDAKLNFGMFAEPFVMATALWSFGKAAEYCKEQNSSFFAECLKTASKHSVDNPW